MQVHTLPLKNMDCEACERLVSMTLGDVAGVAKVQANQREVEVTFDEATTTPAALREALAGIGHAG